MRIQKSQSLLKLYGEWGIKLKIKNLTKVKLKLCLSLLGNILIAFIISLIIYFIIALFFESGLSVMVANLNYDLYAWIVYNRSIVLIIYITIILAVIIYRFISKYVNGVNEVYKALDLVLKEDDKIIKLPSEVSSFSDKLNGIKNDYIRSKNSEKEALQKKNDLIMYMAHDLKNPLTSIIGYLTLLNDEKNISKKTQNKYIKIALDKALRVEDLTNQFFDITRYNLREMPINKQEINLAYLLKQLVDEYYPVLEKKQLKCNLTVPDKLMYMGDGDKLARAFDNLLKNAINYSYSNTEIDIELKKVSKKIMITFKNKGAKIPQYKLDKIFEKFYRVDDSRASASGGAGLGLAITKEIIELHNGSIKVKNDDEFIEFIIEL